MCDILSEITMHLKTQENTTYDKKKSISWNRPRNDTVIGSVDKDIDGLIITVLLMIRELLGKLNILSRNMKTIKKLISRHETACLRWKIPYMRLLEMLHYRQRKTNAR